MNKRKEKKPSSTMSLHHRLNKTVRNKVSLPPRESGYTNFYVREIKIGGTVAESY